jgi:hypothetical protein
MANSDESYVLLPNLGKEIAIIPAKSAQRCFRAHLPPISNPPRWTIFIAVSFSNHSLTERKLIQIDTNALSSGSRNE